MKFREFYPKLLSQANKVRSSTKIDSDDFADSADVYERIFLSCSKEVFILARGIKSDIFDYDFVQNAAIKFLENNNAKLNLILRVKNKEDYTNTLDSAFMRNILKELSGSGKVNIKFYDGDDEWLPEIGSTTIGDDRIYKYKYPQDEQNVKETPNSIVCFNDIETCAYYKKRINDALKGIIPYETVSY